MPINRKALVARHRITMTQPDARAPLSVGNGEFAFTADITGLQTFPDFHMQGIPQLPAFYQGKPTDPQKYSTQLGTQSQWGWHSMPNPEGYQLENALTDYETPRGPVTFPDKFSPPSPIQSAPPEQAAGQWLYANPQRLDLGRIGLEFPPADQAPPVQITDLTDTEQTLDLWRGLLKSTFHYNDQPVQVWTVCHPQRDLLAVRVQSPLLATGTLAVRIAFPYASDHWLIAADWDHPERHTTNQQITGTHATFARILDDDHYTVSLSWTKDAQLTPTAPHQYRLAALGTETLEFVCEFAPSSLETSTLPVFSQVQRAAAEHWKSFWSEGGAVDLSGSTDPRAPELERRIVLSQYQTAINCAGTLPPQETGLVCNSWQGKFHLEMHWWHAVHFMLWGRAPLFERSLPWYQNILPQARETARRQGYQGARWPKQVGPEAHESPSGIGPFLIWQQPHPIYYAELLWRLRPEQATLERYQEIVFETATFMASYPIFDGQRYVLGPPLIPAQENYAKQRATIINPTFELAYWYWGLDIAQRWRERLGIPRDLTWERVKRGLARPTVRDGVYAAIETPPYTTPTDHPSMVGALGFLPQTPLIDPEIMRKTLHAVQQEWNWPSTWGWDYPLLAMCAARLDEPETAIEMLMMDTPKNIYLANGHNQQRPTMLPIYLPGNGGLLTAIALMAAGWDGAPDRPTPGFPSDGSWKVQVEGLSPMP
jgi:hypothetical protein